MPFSKKSNNFSAKRQHNSASPGPNIKKDSLQVCETFSILEGKGPFYFRKSGEKGRWKSEAAKNFTLRQLISNVNA